MSASKMIQVGPGRWMDPKRAEALDLKAYTPPARAVQAPAASRVLPAIERTPAKAAVPSEPTAEQASRIRLAARKELLAEQHQRLDGRSFMDWPTAQAVHDILGDA